MPIVNFKINIKLNENQVKELLTPIPGIFEKTMGKPASTIMSTYSYSDILLNDSFSSAAFVEVRNLSVYDIDVYKNISKCLLDVIKKVVTIDSDRIYINFLEVKDVQAWQFKDDEPISPCLGCK